MGGVKRVPVLGSSRAKGARKHLKVPLHSASSLGLGGGGLSALQLEPLAFWETLFLIVPGGCTGSGEGFVGPVFSQLTSLQLAGKKRERDDASCLFPA